MFVVGVLFDQLTLSHTLCYVVIAYPQVHLYYRAVYCYQIALLLLFGNYTVCYQAITILDNHICGQRADQWDCSIGTMGNHSIDTAHVI